MTSQWIGSVLIGASLMGCWNQDRYAEDQVLLSPAGVSETGFSYVNKDVLNLGWRVYKRNCAACHGDLGDGRGYAAPGLNPPPRDLREGVFKFGGVIAGTGLPHTEDLERIIRDGLHGTPMLEWDTPKGQIEPLIWFLKSLSDEGKGWRSADAELGEHIAIPKDPYAGDEAAQAEAAIRGSALYHADATCWKCHPAYESRETVWQQAMDLNVGAPQFASDMYQSKPKESKYSIAGQPGFISILPPDFTLNEIRSGNQGEKIYRVISAGVNGTAMTSWQEFYIDAIEASAEGTDPDPIWDLTYFIMKLQNKTTSAESLKERSGFRSSLATPWVDPKGDDTATDDSLGTDSAE
jgi:mono/diheme cytochrome c family protein